MEIWKYLRVYLFSFITVTVHAKTLVTFNVGLTRTVPLYEERRQPVVDALKKETADVLCIQEAWNGIDVNNIVNGLKPMYNYSYSRIQQCDGNIKPGPACRPSDEKSVECFKQNCFQIPLPKDKINCMINQCSLMLLDQACISCILMSEPKVSSIRKDCFTSPFTFNNDGLLLLSKTPLCNVRLQDFEPGIMQLAPRAFISARVRGLGNVICTHLTAALGKDYLEPNLPKYGSWEKQNLGEVQRLVKETQNKKKAIVMGTLNTGPAVPSKSVAGVFPISYSEIQRNSLKSPYVDLDGECNLCVSNAFNKGFISESSIASHILTRGHSVKSARRRFDDLIQGKEYPLSYHYGVEITV